MKHVRLTIAIYFVILLTVTATVVKGQEQPGEGRWLPALGEQPATIETRDLIYTYPSTEVLFAGVNNNKAGGKAVFVYSGFTSWKAAESWTYLKKNTANPWYLCSRVADFYINGLFIGSTNFNCDYRTRVGEEVKEWYQDNRLCLSGLSYNWSTNSAHIAVKPNGVSRDAKNYKALTVPCGG